MVMFGLLLPACGPGSPLPKPTGVQVSGKVQLPNGSPLTGGTLVLRPEAGVFGATAQIKADGSFTLQDGGDESVVPGKYQVFVRVADPAQTELRKQVPGKYQESSEDVDSDVVVEITGSTQDLIIKLKS
jgi:hypothetical protein